MDPWPLLLVFATVAAGCVGDPALIAPPAAPRVDSMAALGDSITTAANLGRDRVGESPPHSWAAGRSADDGVESHHERLLPDVEGRVVNLARGGARMADLPRQADGAVVAGARYVTILMGGNDACAPTVAGMTPVETYRAQFRDAAERLRSGLPEGAVVYVASVPDLAQLRDLLWDDARARQTWRALGACQALLSERATPEDVEAVRARVAAYNEALREEAESFGFHHDGGAVFREETRRQDVSGLDYFHPSLEGQRRLAETTWRAGPLAGRGP